MGVIWDSRWTLFIWLLVALYRKYYILIKYQKVTLHEMKQVPEQSAWGKYCSAHYLYHFCTFTITFWKPNDTNMMVKSYVYEFPNTLAEYMQLNVYGLYILNIQWNANLRTEILPNLVRLSLVSEMSNHVEIFREHIGHTICVIKYMGNRENR